MERFLALDLGTKTLGIAISDTLGIAHGYEQFNFEVYNYKKARNHVKEVVTKENISTIILGYPLHMSGELSDRAKSCIRFKEDLEKEIENVTIILVDERLTTVEATDRLHALGLNSKQIKEVIDKMSAVVILENYIGRLKKND